VNISYVIHANTNPTLVSKSLKEFLRVLVSLKRDSLLPFAEKVICWSDEFQNENKVSLQKLLGFGIQAVSNEKMMHVGLINVRIEEITARNYIHQLNCPVDALNERANYFL